LLAKSAEPKIAMLPATATIPIDPQLILRKGKTSSERFVMLRE
jgi:hypothetical protein